MFRVRPIPLLGSRRFTGLYSGEIPLPKRRRFPAIILAKRRTREFGSDSPWHCFRPMNSRLLINSSLTRRELLRRTGTGLGALALASLLAEDAKSQGPTPDGQRPHYPARARRVVHLFMNGGPAHMDTFDPKPLLTEYHGKPIPNSLRTE